LPEALIKYKILVEAGCGSFFCTGKKDGRIGKKPRRRRGNESQEEQTGTKPADESLVSAGLRDVLGMSEWRKEHPKATFRVVLQKLWEERHGRRLLVLAQLRRPLQTDWR
jgi:hypothetical protein